MKDTYDLSSMKQRTPVRVDVPLNEGDVKNSLESKLKFFSIQSALEIKNGFKVRKGFFIVKNECFVVFNKSLQMNTDVKVIEYLKNSLYPGFEVRELTLYLPEDFISDL